MIWDIPDRSGAAGIDYPDTHNLVICANVIDMKCSTNSRGIWGRSWGGGDSARNIVIGNNVIHGGRYGITVEHQCFEDVLIRDNVITETQEDGVFLTHGHGGVVEGNRFSRIGRRAIHAQNDAKQVIVKDNIIRDMQANDNAWTNTAISLTAGAGHHVSGNDIRGNPTGSAIVIVGADNTITNNVIHDLQGHGIVLMEQTNGNYVAGNHIVATKHAAIEDRGQRNLVRQVG